MPAPIINRPIQGTAPNQFITIEQDQAELQRVVNSLYGTANPEDRERAEDAADRAAADRALAQTAANTSTTQAGIATQKALDATLAAIAGGAPIVTALPSPVPANGTTALLQTDGGLVLYEVVAGAWASQGGLIKIGFALTRAALAALDTDTYAVAYLTEAQHEGMYQWDSIITPTEHQDPRNVGLMVAPNPAANGAWRRTSGGSPRQVQTPDVIDLRPRVAGRERRAERVWQLSDPTLARNYDREVILVGQPPVRAWCDGLQWWDLGAGTVIDPWWLPSGAVVHVDFDNERFYWDGEIKSIGDLTDNGDGSFILIPDAPIDFSSGEQVIVYDRTFDMAGSPGGVLWQVREGTGSVGSLRAQPPALPNTVERIIGNYYATSGQTINLSMTSIAGETATFPNTGRHRQLVRMKNGQQITYQPDNGDYREVVPAGARVVTTIPDIERITLNCSWATGSGPGSLLTDATLHTFTMYDRDVTEAELEAVGRTGIAPPAHILGDSFATLYRPQHNINKLLEDEGIPGCLPLSSDAIGGTTLDQQFVRYRDNNPKWRRSTLVIAEMGASFNMIEALKDILGLIEHERWLVLEPAPNKGQILGTPGRIAWDKRREELKQACGPNWVPTLELALSLSDGSPEDEADVANGIWPRSLTKSGTDFHPGARGDDFLAWVIFNALAARGWLYEDLIAVFPEGA